MDRGPPVVGAASGEPGLTVGREGNARSAVISLWVLHDGRHRAKDGDGALADALRGVRGPGV